MSKKLTKMSKSKGNVVLPEEVAKGVYDLDPRYEFRNSRGEVIDWKLFGVWRHHETGYLTSTKTRRRPVFLHEKDNPVPCVLGEQIQHPELFEYWIVLLGALEE